MRRCLLIAFMFGTLVGGGVTALAQQPTPSQAADTLLSNIVSQAAYLVNLIKQQDAEINELKKSAKPVAPPAPDAAPKP